MQTSLLPIDASFHHSLTPTLEDGAGGNGDHAETQHQLLHEGSASSQSTRNVTMTPIMSTDEGMGGGGGDANALPNVESPEKVAE